MCACACLWMCMLVHLCMCLSNYHSLRTNVRLFLKFDWLMDYLNNCDAQLQTAFALDNVLRCMKTILKYCEFMFTIFNAYVYQCHRLEFLHDCLILSPSACSGMHLLLGMYSVCRMLSSGGTHRFVALSILFWSWWCNVLLMCHCIFLLLDNCCSFDNELICWNYFHGRKALEGAWKLCFWLAN